MTYSINAKALKFYAPKSNESTYLSAEAEKIKNQTFYDFKKLWYAARQIAWKYRDTKKIFWDAVTKGELEQFRDEKPGIRNKKGDYTNSQKYNPNQVNLYLWQEFVRAWEEAIPLETAQGLKTYKDLSDAQLELIKFVYQNWGDKLLKDYIPVSDSLEPNCRFKYYLEEDDITVAGQLDEKGGKRQISISSPHLPTITINQRKGETCWRGSITINSNQTINSQQALTYSKMMELASKLHIQIKDFIASPEEFLGMSSAKQRNQLYRHLKQVMIEINNDYLAKRNAYKKENASSQRLFNEVTIADTSNINQIVEDETEINEIVEDEVQSNQVIKDKAQSNDNQNSQNLTSTNNKSKNNPQIKTVKTTVKFKNNQAQAKKRKQLEAEAWLAANPEYAEDLDLELGISEVDDNLA